MFASRMIAPSVVLGFAAAIGWPLPSVAQDKAHDLPTRDQIPDQYKWDLETIYPDAQSWEADFKRCGQAIARLEKRKGTLGHSAKDLYAALEQASKTRWQVDRLAVYAHQRSDEDTGNTAALGPKNRTIALGVAFDQATSWIEPELLTLPERTLRAWCKEHDGLSVYTHYLDNVIRKKAHTLSAREEELLAMAGGVASAPGEVYNVLSNAEMIWPSIRDEEGKSVALSSSRYNKFIRSSDRRVRREAFMGCMQAFKGFENTFAATLNGAVQRDLFRARARGFDSCLEASLFPDNLPLSVFTNLVETINKHLPTLHRWAALRKRVLKLDDLHVYDLYQPLTQAREYEYAAAVEMIIKGLAPLGPEYCDAVKTGFASRWIDVYETKGKRAGAYSWGSYDTQPFILLNYNKTMRAVSTVAHEMGHSMHSYMTHKNQPMVYGEYSKFVAEVASTLDEILLMDHMLSNTNDPKERLFLLNYAIDGLRSTVIRQTMFAEFEQGIHQMAENGEPLTADSMGNLYMDIFHKYWGPEVVRDEEHHSYWGRIPHFYWNFYVYRYATSYSAAAALVEGIIEKRPGALEAYHTFLKSGSSDYPLEILIEAGVDMNTPDPIEATMRRFAMLITEMERLMGETGIVASD